MSLPKVDYEVPITIRILKLASPNGRIIDARIARVSILWDDIVRVEEEPYQESWNYPELIPEIKKDGGITALVMRDTTVFAVLGTFRALHSAWTGYCVWKKKRSVRIEFNAN